MRAKFKLNLFFILSIVQLSIAQAEPGAKSDKRGHEVGNGGLAVFCQNIEAINSNDHLFLYDHLLWHLHTGKQSKKCLHSIVENKEINQALSLALNTIASKTNDPKLTNILAQNTKRILNSKVFTDLNSVTGDYPFNLKYGKESKPFENCYSFQTAIQTHNPLNVKIDFNLWQRLDTEQRVLLLIHEAVYLHELETSGLIGNELLEKVLLTMLDIQDLLFL